MPINQISGKGLNIKFKLLKFFMLSGIIIIIIVVSYFLVRNFIKSLNLKNPPQKNISSNIKNLPNNYLYEESNIVEQIDIPAPEAQQNETVEVYLPSTPPDTKLAVKEEPIDSRLEAGTRWESPPENTKEEILTPFQTSLNPSYYVEEGTLMRCNLLVDIISTIQSKTKCQLEQNIFSKNGENILIPANSIAYGQSIQGIIRGQNRIFITWYKIKTPDGLIIPLGNSSSADKMGAIGNIADVKSNFLARFSNALAITVLSTGIKTAFKSVDNSLKKK